MMVVFEDTASPLSELDIQRVERRLGMRLPQDLKEHYLLHNAENRMESKKSIR